MENPDKLKFNFSVIVNENRSVSKFVVVNDCFFIDQMKLQQAVDLSNGSALVLDSKEKDGSLKVNKSVTKSDDMLYLGFFYDGKYLGKETVETLRFINELMKPHASTGKLDVDLGDELRRMMR